MPPRPKLEQLPPDVKRAWDAQLVKHNFCNYQAMCTWLKTEFGINIGKSAAAQYGQRYKDRIEAIRLATEHAGQMRDAFGEDDGAVAEGVMRAIQQAYFQLAIKGFDDPNELNKATMAVAKIIAVLSDHRRTNAALAEKVRAAAAQVNQKLALHDLPPAIQKTVEQLILQIGDTPPR